MGRAKEIIIKVIPASVANPFVKKHHYSGKIVNNSKLHFGAFLDGKLHGVMSFGSSMDKSKIIRLVKDTGWNDFLELNRMAFDEYLPRNSESFCISKAIKLIKKNAPHIKWIISFADGCSCGDGTIYRASNFVLTDIRENKNLCLLPSGEKIHKMTLESSPNQPRPELGGGRTISSQKGVIPSKSMLKLYTVKYYQGINCVIFISLTNPIKINLLFRFCRFQRLMNTAQECIKAKG